MRIEETVDVVVRWIDQADSPATQLGGSYSDRGRASHLRWMKSTLLSAPTREVQQALIDHWIGTGALPRDLCREYRNQNGD